MFDIFQIRFDTKKNRKNLVVVVIPNACRSPFARLFSAVPITCACCCSASLYLWMYDITNECWISDENMYTHVNVFKLKLSNSGGLYENG